MAQGADALANWVASSLLLSLRIAPTLLFAPPFSLARLPKLVLALMGIAIAALMISAFPNSQLREINPGILASAAFGEVTLGLIPLVVLQFMFGALQQVGRTIDIQSGFSLALLIDPATRGQVPLVGTLFAYIAGVTFFALDGHLSLLKFWAASLESVPIGSFARAGGVAHLGSYMLVVSLIALGIGGVAILALFLSDIVVAMLSRTVPQLNALLLGIQVKAILLLAVLPLSFGASAAFYMQMVSVALDAIRKLS